ncbi:hypothetical protein KA043_01775, partial [Candidatus Saccharibacteria bacterium]|nr:hypothetical protein [Candidatus Saccharibacteria bacterium]
MNSYEYFVFKSYSYDSTLKTATFKYSIDDKIFFKETFTFDFEHVNYEIKALDIALRNLFLLCGVSYYKTYLPKNIKIEGFELSKNQANFYSNTWQKGLRELFYTNNLPISTPVNFPYNENIQDIPVEFIGSGKLVAVGGGKDSLVSVGLLEEKMPNEKVATWSVGHRKQLESLVDLIGHEHFYIERKIDTLILSSLPNTYNGHIPVSSIFAGVGTVLAVLTGYKDIVLSNESSANEPTTVIDGEQINHQYSKSLEFEKDYQKLLLSLYGDSIRYYSLLRHLNEVQISKLFRENGFSKYKNVFCSCNKAFRQDQTEISWCNKCPKCAFVFLVLTSFVNKNELENAFNGNPLIDPKNQHIYNELLGNTKNKPFECIGTIEESKWSMLNA